MKIFTTPWASATANKQIINDAQAEQGIIFGSTAVSAEPNGALFRNEQQMLVLSQEVENVITGAGIVINPADSTQLNQAIRSLLGFSEGYINGLLPSNGTDASNDIDFGIGKCRDSANTLNIISSSVITKRRDANWASGTNQGGFPAGLAFPKLGSNLTGTFTSSTTAITGSGTAFLTEFSVGDYLWASSKTEARRITAITSNTAMTISATFTTNVSVGIAPIKADFTVHCFVLANASGGMVDFGFDTDINATNLLADANVVSAGFTKHRRVASLLTDQSKSFLSFTSRGGTSLSVFFKSPSLIAIVNPGTSETYITVDCPSGISPLYYGSQIIYQVGAATSVYCLLHDSSVTTSVASTTNCDVRLSAGAQANTHGAPIQINYDSKIAFRFSFSNSATNFDSLCKGYIDERL